MAAGAALTVAAHGLLAVLLVLATAPDPVPEPGATGAAFDIASYPVRETRAEERVPEAETAAAAEGTGLRAAGAAIPRSSAVPLAAPSARLAAVSSPAARAPDLPAEGASIAARPPGDNRLPEAPLAAAPVAALSPADAVVAPLSAPATPVARRAPAGPTLAAAPVPKESAAELAADPSDAASPPARASVAAPLTVAGGRARPVSPVVSGLDGVAPRAEPAAALAPESAPGPALAPVSAPGQVVREEAAQVAALRPAAPRAAAAAQPVTAARPAEPTVSAVLPAGIAVTPAEASAIAATEAGPAEPAAAPAPVLRPPLEALVAAKRPGREHCRAGFRSAIPAARRRPAPASLVAVTASAEPAEGRAAAEAELPSRPASASEMQAPPLPPSVPDAQPARVGAAPAEDAAPVAPSGPALAAREGAPVAVPLATPEAHAAPPLAPAVERRTAALAWSGEGHGRVDPLSLAAIQSFTRAGDPAPGAPRVRDEIGALLAAVPCARLRTIFDPETGALELRGHLPEPELRAPVLEALAAQVGAAIPLRDNTLVLPRPVCGVLAEIGRVGLAQSDEQEGDPRVVGPQPFAEVRRFVEGEVLEFNVTGPDYPAYFYVDYFDAEGQVIHLQPNALVPPRRIAPGAVEPVGVDAEGDPAIEITVAPPFGQEIMAAFAASEPLYDGVRPTVESAATYLAFLKDAVARARAANPGFRGEWFYYISVTVPG